MVRRIVIALPLLLFSFGALASSARAAAIGCYDGEFFPRGGDVPANLPGVLFWPTTKPFFEDDAGAAWEPSAHVALARVDAEGALEPVEFTLMGTAEPYLVVPTAGFEAGTEYRIWTTPCGETELPEQMPTGPFPLQAGDETPIPFAILQMTDEADPPRALPPLSLGEPVQEEVAYQGDCSGCSGPSLAVNIYAELDGELGPWANALAFLTLVDEQPYRPSAYYKFETRYGKSWVGPARDRLTTICEGQHRDRPLEAGEHSMRMTATVPGMELELTTQRQSFTLDCGDVAEPSPMRDAGVRPPSVESSDPQQDRRDVERDFEGDGGPDAARAAARASDNGDEGEGGCDVAARAGASPAATSPAWLALVALGILGRRRGRGSTKA